MDDWTPTEKVRFDKAKSQIIALLNEANRQRLGQGHIERLGFKITIWKRGIEICRPKAVGEYTVSVVGWWPPLWKTRIEGCSTCTG